MVRVLRESGGHPRVDRIGVPQVYKELPNGRECADQGLEESEYLASLFRAS